MQASYPGKDLEAMSFARNYHRWILDLFQPHLGRSIGEVGAGVGDFTQLLLESQPRRITAWEPSPNLLPDLRERFHHDSRVRVIPDRFSRPSEPLDTLCYINVLEHIEDDCAELRKARSALAPGGKLCIFVPALSWLFGEQDRRVGHFRRYGRRELRTKLRDAGFELVEDRWFDIAGILPWWIAFCLLRRQVTPGNVGSYDHLVVPVMRRVEGLIRPPLGKNLLAVARPGIS